MHAEIRYLDRVGFPGKDKLKAVLWWMGSRMAVHHAVVQEKPRGGEILNSVIGEKDVAIGRDVVGIGRVAPWQAKPRNPHVPWSPANVCPEPRI